jgi:hypothetical protein
MVFLGLFAVMAGIVCFLALATGSGSDIEAAVDFSRENEKYSRLLRGEPMSDDVTTSAGTSMVLSPRAGSRVP